LAELSGDAGLNRPYARWLEQASNIYLLTSYTTSYNYGDAIVQGDAYAIRAAMHIHFIRHVYTTVVGIYLGPDAGTPVLSAAPWLQQLARIRFYLYDD
jgi:hypothetical protein